MAASGIAKRASIDVGFTDTSFVENMDKFKDILKGSNREISQFHNALDRSDQSLSRFNQHMSTFADRFGSSMSRVRQDTRDTADATERMGQSARRFADTYNSSKERINSANRQMDESERQRSQNAADNERKINQALSHTSTAERRNADELARDNERLKSKLNGIGNASQHASRNVASANGRVAHSFGNSNRAIDRHAQSIRDAQGRDYRWLRTAQDMSGATLGLGAAFYKGAKDATTLQQAYTHAGNMAHYGGEKLSSVQKDINQQYNVGTSLSEKYGVSQNQIAKGYQTLIARGYSTTEALHAQKSMLQASIASGDDYNDVVNNSSNIIDAFGLRTNNAAKMATNAKTAVNQMAYAADQTASNFKDLGYGMAYVGATAHTAHQSIAETSSALGILSNKGMQASMAGTGLRKVLNSFLSINKKGQQAQVMQQLGLTEQDFKTPEGNLKSLSSLMSILNDKTKNMDSQERASVFHKFFGSTGQEAALNLASDTKGLAHLNDQVERSQNMGHGKGYVALLSGRNMKTAQNQLHVFEQSWQAFTITAAREILPTLSHALQHFDVLLGKMNDLSPKAKKWTIFGALAVAAISPISYGIFGIQSAFHGVEITLLHVRKLFSKPMPTGMTRSAEKQAAEQDLAAGSGAKGNDMDRLAQDDFGRNHGMLGRLANIGGDYGPLADTSIKPSLLARLNPFNKSARLFTGRFNPFMNTKSATTGLAADNALRNGALKPLTKGLGTGLGSLAAAVPDAMAAFKAKNKASQFKDWGSSAGTALGAGIGTAIGGPLVGGTVGGSLGHLVGGITGKLLHSFSQTKLGHQLGHFFSPLGKSLENGLRGPLKFMANSWKFIKRGALDAIRPIEREWNKMFNTSHMSKGTRQDMRAIGQFVHVVAHLFAGLWRTTSKVLGNILKYGGRVIAGVMRTLRGITTVAGGVIDLLTFHFKRGFHLIGHGASITFSGVAKTIWNTIKGVATSVGDVFNGIWTAIKHGASSAVSGIKSVWGGVTKWFSNQWDESVKGLDNDWDAMKTAASDTVSSIKSFFVNGFETMKSDVEGILDDVKGAISDVANAVSHPIKSAESAIHSHAVGGSIQQDEMSLVNEKGRESAYNPATNKFRLFPNNGPQVIPLYAGEHVLTAQDTKELLTTGMGRGVTLPGYAKGTDTLNNVRNSRNAKQLHSYAIGTGRAGAISGEAGDDGSGGENTWNGLKDIESYVPFGGLLSLPSDASGFAQHPIKSALSTASDLPGLSDFKGGKLYRPLGHMLSDIKPFHPLSKFMGTLGKVTHPASSLLHKGMQGAHGLVGKGLSKADNAFDHFDKDAFRPIAKKGLDAAEGLGKKLTGALDNKLMNPIKRKVRQGERTLGRVGRGIGNTTKRLGRNAMNGIRRFGRGLGRTAGRAWRGLKRGAGRMWNGARRMGRNAMRGMRRFGRNVGRGIQRFGRNTMRTGRRLGRRISNGVRKFGRGLMRGGQRMFRRANRGIRRFGRNVMRQGRRIYRGGRRLLSRAGRGIRRFGKRAIGGAKRIGKRIWGTAKGTASRVWGAAKNTGRGVWNGAKRVGTGVLHTGEHAWNTTKQSASRTWTNVKTGAGRMASAVGNRVSHLVSSAKSKASGAWNAIRNGASDAASTAKGIIEGVVNFAEEAASKIKSLLSHLPHFANGGPIARSTMALVGERGPETAYNPRTHNVRMLGMHGPQIAPLLRGEEVLTNNQTERLLHGGLGVGKKLPAYAKGTGASLSKPTTGVGSSFNIKGLFSGKSALAGMTKFGKSSKSIWGLISNNVIKSVRNAHTGSTSEWQGLAHDAGTISTKMSKTTSGNFNNMSDRVNRIVNDLSDGLIQAAKSTAEGFGDKFSKLIDYAKADVKKVISAINRGISGIDTVLKSFGGNAHVIHEIHYATGTMNGRIAYPQIGILNDAVSGPRQEAILRGNQVLMPQGDNVKVPLQTGDAVLNGDQTKQLVNNTTVNHYASGSGLHLSNKMIKLMTRELKTATKSPLQFAKRTIGHSISPSGYPFVKAIESLTGKPLMKLVTPWTKTMFSYIKSLLTPPDDGSGDDLNASDSNGSELLAEAEKLGAAAHNRYVWGANGPSAYDCGGLVLAALHHFGYTSDDRQTIIDHFPSESRADALPGDLVENSEHEGIVADKGAHHYYSAFNPAEGIKMYPLDPTHWTADNPTMHFARINIAGRTSTKPKTKVSKSGSKLQALVKRELGSHAESWLKKAASIFAGGGDADFNSMHIPGGEGDWTKRGSQAWNMARDVFYAAKSLGLDAKHAAAVVGNAWHESAGFQYGLMVNQFGGGGGKGLFQFTGQPSKEGWTPLGQTKSILENATPSAESAWKSESGSPASLSHDFETTFERGSIPAFAARDAAAETAYGMFAANGGWADKDNMRIFGEAGPEVAINPAKGTADHFIVEAINARMHHNSNSPIANLVRSIGIRRKGNTLRTKVSSLLNHANSPKGSGQKKSVNINISFGNIVVNSNGGSVNTGAISHQVKRAIQRGIQKAAYETTNKLNLD